MARQKPNRSSAERPNLYAEITESIIADLEAGRVPWVQPWEAARAPLTMPKNAATGRRYSGINVLILWRAVIARGFTCQSFLTFRQALKLGGNVRKGEHGVTVVFADRFTPEGERRRARTEGREADSIPFLKRFTVFSAEQCENLPDEIYTPPPPIPEGMILPQAKALIDATGAQFRIGGAEAFYSPSHDFVAVPRPEAFFAAIDWHRTAFHELGHWTGHRTRLDREQSGAFGSRAYGREELVAEMAGAFVCASLGITPTVRHADYLGSWLEIIREDNRAIIRAASAASKAADFLLAYAPGAPAPAFAAANDATDERRAA